MNAHIFGRLARIFESRGFADRPEKGKVSVTPIMWGLGLYTASGNQSEEVDALADEITTEDAGRIAPLTEAEEIEFWSGYRTQTPHKRMGRPLKDGAVRRQRTLNITEENYRTLRLAGNGNPNDGLAAIIEEYTRLPDVTAGE